MEPALGDCAMLVVNEDEVVWMERWDGVEAHFRRGAFAAAFQPGKPEDAFRDGPRQFFALAAEVARAQFDPVLQWDDFLEALWEQAAAGFGLSPDDQDLTGGPRAWFEEPDDPDVVVWDEQPGVESG